METVKVYLGKEKKVVEVELVDERGTTIMVKLPDGNVIKRKKSTQVVKEA